MTKKKDPTPGDPNKNYIDELNKKIGIYFENEQYEEALKEVESFQDKENPIYLYYLALIKDKLNNKKEALEILKKLTNNQPSFLEAFHLLANINEDLKQYNDSKNILEYLSNQNPNDQKTKYNLGRHYEYYFNDMELALKLYKEALNIDNQNYQIWNAVSNILIKLKKNDQAHNVLKKIIEIFPNEIFNLKQLAEVQLELGLIDLSENTILKLIKLKKNQNILNLLALCYFKQNRFNECEKILNKVINYKLHNNEEDIAYKRILLLKVYQSDFDHISLSKIIKKYNYLGNKEKIKKFKLGSKKNKKIKIGFVSCDFRKQAINNVIHALFDFKDKKKFEFYCYSSNPDEDEITEWYKKVSDSWKNISTLNDKEASKLIISDNIDILIFLGGYFGENRYLLSTYRSAPKQISFHPISSSYNKTMDYWLSDNILHPLNFKEKVSEKIIRIKSLFNFAKPENLPKINEPPMKNNGYISFGSFNNPGKVSEKCISLWSKVLKHFSKSKIYLRYYDYYNNKKNQDTIYKMFEKNNISKEKIIFLDEKVDIYLKYYNKIDIGLDTFPYSGATTTYSAICMGIPVLSLVGKNYITRQSASILSNVGLSNWIVKKEDEYITKLKKLSEYKHIYKIRSTLRKNLIKSSICNGKEFSKNFEEVMKKIH